MKDRNIYCLFLKIIHIFVLFFCAWVCYNSTSGCVCIRHFDPMDTRAAFWLLILGGTCMENDNRNERKRKVMRQNWRPGRFFTILRLIWVSLYWRKRSVF